MMACSPDFDAAEPVHTPRHDDLASDTDADRDTDEDPLLELRSTPVSARVDPTVAS